MPTSEPVRVRVPAKVNLHLSVGPVRRDGFHELVTVFHAVDLVDDVSASARPGLGLTVSGEGAGRLPTGADNLAWRAAGLLAQTAGREPNAALHVHKAIPVAGGMAGGSADAAGTLLACARLWSLGTEFADLSPLAARLGSDVPFALLGGTAVGTGRGELLRPVSVDHSMYWAFALADFGISTPAAYAELDRQRALGTAVRPAGGEQALLGALETGDLEQVAANLANDLQPAALALAPSLRHTLAVGVAAGALAGIVSGSGPTCAFLCVDAASAEHVATELFDSGACRAARTASGPAPGACVVS